MFILTILEQLSRLEQIHNKGVIHRDIKPENFVIKAMPKKRKAACESEKSKAQNDFT